MIAAVNLLWCRPGLVGGSEEYLARQLVGLGEVAPEIERRLLVPPAYPAAHPELVAGLDVRTGPAWSTRREGRLLAERTWLAHQVGGTDVVHHGGGTVPPVRRRPRQSIVLTVHDLQFLALPQNFSTMRRRYLAAAMPRSARRADVIAVPSEFVHATVVEAFGVDPATVAVVPHGFDPPADPATAADPGELRRRFGLGERRVVVFPAITHPHKGHRFLVDVMSRAWTDPDLVLVLLGGVGAADGDVAAAIESNGLAGRVVRPGRVNAADRDGLIALAEVLVFPSEYEGFGAPVLEAMALGTPVACSDRAALPEVAGDAAVVRPLTVDAWADVLHDVAADRSGLVERGRLRAALFSTAASGRGLAAAYRLALESS